MILYAAGPNLESTVADRGEGPGPLFLDQNEARRVENVILNCVRHCSNMEKNVAVWKYQKFMNFIDGVLMKGNFFLRKWPSILKSIIKKTNVLETHNHRIVASSKI